MEPDMSDFKKHWAAKHKVAQRINSCAPCTLYPPIIKTLQKKESSQVGLLEDQCIKGALKNNAVAERLN